jgi:hypothetical protein
MTALPHTFRRHPYKTIVPRPTHFLLALFKHISQREDFELFELNGLFD